MLTREDLRLATLLCFAFLLLVLAFGFVNMNCQPPERFKRIPNVIDGDPYDPLAANLRMNDALWPYRDFEEVQEHLAGLRAERDELKKTRFTEKEYTS